MANARRRCGVFQQWLSTWLRQIIKSRTHLCGDDAASRLIWLAPHNSSADSSNAARVWSIALNQFAILYIAPFTWAAPGAA